MRRGLFACLVTVSVLTAGLAVAPSAAAKGGRVCTTDQVTQTVICYVADDPSPTRRSHDDNSNDAADKKGCALNGKPLPCAGPQGSWWSKSELCYVILVDPQPPMSSGLWRGQTTGAVYMCLGGQGGYFWAATPPDAATVVTPAQLAQATLAKVKKAAPSPSPGRYPAARLDNGQPYTVVRAYTWYWTSPSDFRPVHARAAVGGVWAEATATPTALTFTPGDGSATVSCAGPGTAWTSSSGPWAASPSGCDYRYPHSSIHQPNREVTATYGITWAVTWAGSGGTGGSLPGFATTSGSTFAVAEVESVVTQ